MNYIDHIISPKVRPWAFLICFYFIIFFYYTRSTLGTAVAIGFIVIFINLWRQSRNRGFRVTWESILLNRKGILLQIFIAIGLSIFGWFYFSWYINFTRGKDLEFSFPFKAIPVIVIILVATAEELFFRGYFQNAIRSSTRFVVRVLITAASMALYKNLIHFSGLSLPLHIELFFIGVLHNILPSLWLEWSDNLTGPLLLHVLWDILVYAPLGEIPDWVL